MSLSDNLDEQKSQFDIAIDTAFAAMAKSDLDFQSAMFELMSKAQHYRHALLEYAPDVSEELGEAYAEEAGLLNANVAFLLRILIGASKASVLTEN